MLTSKALLQRIFGPPKDYEEVDFWLREVLKNIRRNEPLALLSSYEKFREDLVRITREGDVSVHFTEGQIHFETYHPGTILHAPGEYHSFYGSLEDFSKLLRLFAKQPKATPNAN